MAYMLSAKGRRGQLTRAAEALKCQRSYLSRVISENLQLTPDHAFQLANFWKLPQDHSEYFRTLVEFERAGNPDFRRHLKDSLSKMKAKHESVQERTSRTGLSVDALKLNYFSSWISSAVHFLTSVPEYQSVKALSLRLGIKPEYVLKHLQSLQTQGFVEEKNDLWIYKAGEFHAPKDSPLVILHHQNWRNRAIQDAQDPENGNVHFTIVQTLSREDFERLKELMLQFISECTEIAGPSKPEEGIAMTCDLFRV